MLTSTDEAAGAEARGWTRGSSNVLGRAPAVVVVTEVVAEANATGTGDKADANSDGDGGLGAAAAVVKGQVIVSGPVAGVDTTGMSDAGLASSV